MEKKEPQSKIMMLVVCWFIGSLGIHRLMMGYKNWYFMLIATVLTFGVAGALWALYDLVMIAMGNLKMADGSELV